MHVLVTGGAGFIGSHYVRMLLDSAEGREIRVTVLDKLTYAGNLDNLADVAHDARFRFQRGDINDHTVLDAVFPGIDTVVHFAAESHVDRSIDDSTAFLRTNVLGTQSLLDAAVRHGTGTFVHVSTDEVYGSIDHGSWPEDHPLNPSSPYSASKASSDLLALACHRTHGLDVRVTRCSNNYGPMQFPEKVIPRFVTRLLTGRTVPLYGDGGNVRDWLHVEDHCRGIDLVRTKGRPGEIYNIGGGTELSNIALTELLVDAVGADWSQVRHVADRKGHDRRYSVDWSKARDELGYLPRHSLEAGLAATVQWYRDNAQWWQPGTGRAHPAPAACHR